MYEKQKSTASNQDTREIMEDHRRGEEPPEDHQRNDEDVTPGERTSLRRSSAA
jgi:hypothetical protein